MSGVEVVIICAGIVSGLASAISNFLHWRKASKSRKDIKIIKEHVKPRIIISSSGGLTPIRTPEANDEEMKELFPRYEKQELFYDRETGQYYESIPQTAQQNQHPY